MLTIGQFSQACQVTVKTLRHYDKLGLVVPVHIDPQSGYRYYESWQLSRILLIQRLKRYGFSLQAIQQLLSADEHIQLEWLSAQRKILQQQIRTSNLVLQELEQHLQQLERTGNIMSYEKEYQITLKEIAPQSILSVRQRTNVDQFGNLMSRLFERVAEKQAVICGAPFALYHDREFDRENADIELAVPVTNKADRELASCLCAVTVHRGPYSSLNDAYGALTRWIEENNYEIISAPQEIYRSNPQQVPDPAQWETEIRFPVQKKI